MSFATCPKCRDEVRVPSGASDEAQVQCPLCLEEFQLSEALEKLPPSLVVLNDPGGNGASHGGSHFSFGDDHGFDDRGGVALATETKTEAPAFQFESSAPAGDNAVSPASSSSRPAPRRRAKQKNMVVEMVKVVLGGVVGLGGALVALWYLPFGKDCDPFQLGPTIASVVPFIVPEKYRGVVVDDNDSPTPVPENNNSGSFSVDQWPAAQGNQKDDGQVIDTSNVPFGKKRNKGNKKNNTSNNLTDSNDDNSLAANGFSSNPFGGPTTTGSDASTTDVDDNSASAQPVEEGPIEIRNPGMAGVSDLTSAMGASFQSATAWIGAEPNSEVKSTVGRQFYASLARLGEVLMWAEDDDPEILDQHAKLNGYLANIHKRDEAYGSVAFIANEASNWLSNTARDNQGVILAGTVLEVKPRGEAFESQVQLNNESKQKVTVLSFKQPVAEYKRKAKVFLLGVVIDKPRENLSGFNGSETQVVCSAHILSLGVDDTILDEPSEPSPPSPTVESTPMPSVTVPVPTIDIPSFDIKAPTIELQTPKLPSTDSSTSEPAPASETKEPPAESNEESAAGSPTTP